MIRVCGKEDQAAWTKDAPGGNVQQAMQDEEQSQCQVGRDKEDSQRRMDEIIPGQASNPECDDRDITDQIGK